MGLTRASLSLRSYGTLGEIRDLIARTAFTELRYSPVLLLGTLGGLFLTYLLPWVLFFAYPGEAWWFVDTTIALMVASFAITVRFYGLCWAWALTLPVAALFYAYATCVSAVRYRLGRGGQWKGRAQASEKT
ncbi:MAG TPA: glycosyl transferase family 2, partial [Candidatus Dormibacteraeota bacterium]|nr:glycosyl transferase family 2 [Candidatus Dormibacteraeota bacterium]